MDRLDCISYFESAVIRLNILDKNRFMYEHVPHKAIFTITNMPEFTRLWLPLWYHQTFLIVVLISVVIDWRSGWWKLWLTLLVSYVIEHTFLCVYIVYMIQNAWPIPVNVTLIFWRRHSNLVIYLVLDLIFTSGTFNAVLDFT
jgi:hypothetical protein